MSFLNPALLWGLLAVAVPILIFLIFRRKFKRVEWAAMEFLLRAQRRTNRRLKIENLLLLLIRCLILALFALALARPKVASSITEFLPGQSAHHILLIDDSFSMGYQIEQFGGETFMTRAHKEAMNIVNRMGDEDEVSVIRVGAHPEIVVENNVGKDDHVFGRITDTAVSHGGADLGLALVKAKQVIEQSSKETQRVYLLTDFQSCTFFQDDVADESAEPGDDGATANPATGLNAVELLTKELSDIKGLSFYIIDVGDESAVNRQVRSLSATELKIISGIETDFFAEVFNHGNQPDQNYDLVFRVDGEEKDRAMIDVLPSRESAEVSFRHAFNEPGFHYVAVEAADSSKDLLTVDDARYLAVEVLPNIRVLVVNGEVATGPQDEVYYLETLFSQEEMGGARLPVKADFVLESELTPGRLKDYDVVLMCNVGSFEDSLLRALDDYVRLEGRSIVWYLGDQVDRDFYNAKVYNNAQGLLPAKLQGVAGDPTRKEFVYMQPKSFDHPMLNYAYYEEHPVLFKMPFIYEYYTLESYDFDPLVRTVLTYNNGEDAAILEKSVGRGKCLLVTTSVDAEWTNMPAFPIYVALTGDMIFYLAYQDRSDLNLPVGGRIVREYPLDYSDKPEILTPEQGNVKLEATTVGGSARQAFFDRTNTAGVYQLFAAAGETADGVKRDLNIYFSVNVDPAEGNLYRATEQQLKARYPAFAFTYRKYNPEQSILRDAEEDGRMSELWKYFAFAVLGLLIAESLLAQRFGQYRKA